MSLYATWLHDEVWVLRPGWGVDRYGNPVRSLASDDAEAWLVPGRIVEDAQVEAIGDQQTVTTYAKGYVPIDTDIVATDVVEHGGTKWEVTGVVSKSLPVASGSYRRLTLRRLSED